MIKLALTILSIISSISCAAEFALNPEPVNINSPIQQLGINMVPELIETPPSWIRQSLYKSYAGDYYRSPFPIPKSIIKEDEKISAWTFLNDGIKPANYDSSIFNNICAYEYKLLNEDAPRRDIFLRYSKADTIYVLSSWSGKFISFYRSVPRFSKYNLDELNKNIAQISRLDIKIPTEIYEHCSRDIPYFIEYVDKVKMLRIRCYHISEQRMNGEVQYSDGPYTLIEITRFLDKEMVP